MHFVPVASSDTMNLRERFAPLYQSGDHSTSSATARNDDQGDSMSLSTTTTTRRVRREKRKASNRASAKKSRARIQAQLARLEPLERENQQLRQENNALRMKLHQAELRDATPQTKPLVHVYEPVSIQHALHMLEYAPPTAPAPSSHLSELATLHEIEALFA